MMHGDSPWTASIDMREVPEFCEVYQPLATEIDLYPHTAKCSIRRPIHSLFSCMPPSRSLRKSHLISSPVIRQIGRHRISIKMNSRLGPLECTKFSELLCICNYTTIRPLAIISTFTCRMCRMYRLRRRCRICRLCQLPSAPTLPL